MVEPLAAPVASWVLALACILGYGLGSIPFGLLLTRWAGAGDIRQIGSGNIGATNVLRTGRKGLALATLLLDMAKGGVPTALAYGWFGPTAGALAGAGAIIGHCYPAWLGFKGGKGVATAAGVVLGLAPLTFVIILAAFILIVWATRWVSLGSMAAAALAPVVAYFLGQPQAALLFVLVAVVVILKHRENIKRLLAGSENRLSFGKKA